MLLDRMADAQYFELCSSVIVRLVFALRGSVMNTMPPSCITEVRTDVLIDTVADLNLSCPRKIQGSSRPHWHGLVPYDTICHHDLCRTVGQRPWLTMIAILQIIVMSVLYGFVMNTVPQWSLMVAFQKSLSTWWGLFIFFLRGSTVYNHHTCAVSSGDDHHLEVFFVRFGSCRCYVWIVWYRDEHHTNGDRHDGSHPRVLSVTLPVIAAWLQSMSQCCTLLYLFCLVRWWTPYHHDHWGMRSPKRLVVMSIVVIGLCGLVIHIHSHDTWWTLTPEVSVVMIAVVLCYLLQLNRPPSSMREICSAWSRDV